jgi:hypothetical protein
MVKKIKKRRRGRGQAPARKETQVALATDAKSDSAVSVESRGSALPDRRSHFSISLCMIVKNESRLISECLRRAATICSQMIVVDTGSDDNTASLAEAAGAEVYHHPWPGHFSVARNISLDYARNDWILILDGDELLEPDTMENLEPQLLGSTDADAVEFEIVNFISDEALFEEAYFQRQIRMFRREEHHRYEGLIHNQLVDVRTKKALNSIYRPVRVLHYGYTPTVWGAQNKDARLSMLQKAVSEEPDSLFCRYNLANHLKILGDPAAALENYQLCFAGDIQEEWVRFSFFSAAYCANQVEQYPLAIDICDQILGHLPFLADAHLRKSEALLALGQPEAVVRALEGIIDDSRLWAYKQHARVFALPYRLGLAYFETQKFEQAIPVFQKLSDSSTDPTVLTHLCLCALHCSRIDLARDAYHRGLSLAPDDPDWPRLKHVFESNQIPL